MFPPKTLVLSAALIVVFALSPAAHSTSNVNDQLDKGIDLFEDHRFENASELLEDLIEGRYFRKLDATEKALALSHFIYSLLEQDKARKALSYTKILLSNTQYGFGNYSEQYVEALFVKARVQYRAGKTRDAIRTVEQMSATLERMGDEYSEERRDARSLPSQIRKKEWNKKRLRKDLSDFYTKCEAIESGDPIPAAARTLNKYKLVGRDYRPSGRVKRNFKNTYIKRARENSSDRANRIIYIPDKEHLDDWCVLYPDGNVVDRAISVPPEE